MKDNKSIKALKKQMAAAVAMVCVAGVALGSSTYAWFVNNNTVTGTTASISAQSNAPFLVISNDAITKTSTKTEETTTVADKTLYPVQMVAASDDATTFTWQSRQTHEWLSTANSVLFCFLSFQKFFQILDWQQTYYEPFLPHRQLMSC